MGYWSVRVYDDTLSFLAVSLRERENRRMVSRSHSSASTFRSDRRFATTHWSMVLAAGRADDDDGQGALTQLCAIYWEKKDSSSTCRTLWEEENQRCRTGMSRRLSA